MVDPATGIAAAKLAYDAIQKIWDTLNQKKPDLNAVKAHIRQLEQITVQFQQSVYELQKENLDLKAKNHELQKQVDAERNWERIRNRYVLKEVFPGTRLYILREADDGRRLCQKCFERDHKEITLQDGSGGDDYLRCRVCDSTYQISEHDYPRRAVPPNMGMGF